MSSPELGPNFLVVPDLHGESEFAEKAVQLGDKLDATLVILGDMINRGPNSKQTIDIIRSLGSRAIPIVGNHEWFCRNALLDPDNEWSAKCRDDIWTRFEDTMLESYGIERENDTVIDALHLRQAMDESGHWDWMEELPPFYESDDFIAIHSGPIPSIPWHIQARQITEEARLENRMYEEPIQIIDQSHRLSDIISIPEKVDPRIFVTGHKHTSRPAEQRAGKRRIRLASKLSAGNPLFVWESRTGAIHVIDRDPDKSQILVVKDIA